MEPDDAADLIEELQEKHHSKAEKILNAIPKKEQNEIRQLLQYEEDSAGALMTTTYLKIPENLTVEKAIIELKKQNPPESELSFYIFIINQEKKLVGYTTIRD